MISLSNLKDCCRNAKKRRSKRVGRGAGSGLGKTCGRGHKGAGSRSGYTRRYTYEGGQFRTYMKMPIRGFSNVRFQKRLDVVNLDQINEAFQDGETVDIFTLAEKGFIKGATYGVKILGRGVIGKKITIQVDEISNGAIEKLKSANVTFQTIDNAE